MKFILGLLGVSNPAGWVIYAIQGAAIVAALVAGYQLIDNNWATDAGIKKGEANIQVKFDKFVSNVKAQGEAAQAKAKQIEADDLKRKELTDANHKTAVATLAATVGQLRRDEAAARTARSRLPAAPSGSSRPDLACFDRTEYQRAYGESFDKLRDELRRLADEGTTSTVDLNAAKQWAQHKP